MLSDPNDEELYQIVVDVATGKWEPLSVEIPYPEDDEPDPAEYHLAEPLTAPDDRDTTGPVDRSAGQIPLPKEGFV